MLCQVADAINRAHKDVPGVKVLLENMSGQGSALGSSFEELRCGCCPGPELHCRPPHRRHHKGL